MFNFQVLTCDRELFAGSATSVSADALDGEITILTGHAPLMTILKAGEIHITVPDGKCISLKSDGGLLKVKNNKAVALIEQTS
jgi:F-type H+-transporting ATPase subunit epsilon